MKSYIIILIIAMVYAFIRAKHDFYIREGMWKRWAVVEAGFFAGVISCFTASTVLEGIVLFFIFSFAFWLVFDWVIGFLFGHNIFYLGSGRFDIKMRNIFINGFLYTVFKLVWLGLFTGLYFAMI